MSRVRALDGSEWEVVRTWGWRPRRRSVDGADLSGFDLPDIGDGIAGLVISVVVAILLVLFVIPLVIFVGEAMLILAVFCFLPFFHRWNVIARRVGDSGSTRTWKVTGLRRSSRVRSEVVEALETGRSLDAVRA